MPVVLCKPDVLYGPTSTVGGQRARALMRALAAQLAGGDLTQVDPVWRTSAQRAAQQVTERAVSEPSFRGSVRDAATAGARLLKSADRWNAEEYTTTGVLRATVRGLGFAIVGERGLVLGEDGVDAVYAGATTTVEYTAVREQLLEYLAAAPVLAWRLSDDQDPCVLQWWKTYVRHLLLDRRPGEYLLRNLVHVCEASDGAYLERRMAG